MMRWLLPAILLRFSMAGVAGDYTEQWNQFETRLIVREKSFQNEPALAASQGTFKRVEYSSDGMQLSALLDTRNIDPADPGPAIVYLHGGFGLRPGELRAATIFSDAGFVVLTPTWRGENANPGYFECFMGEVADARAAIRWLASQPYVDDKQIYVFGWSVGGGIALNLALHDDIPVRLSGSSAGIYDLPLITSWATEDDLIKFPYDYRDERENYFRLPLYHLQDMARPHHAYLGTEDGYAEAALLYKDLYPTANTHLELIEVPGDHVGSLPLAIKKFIELIASQR
jgi:dienelactone hydrolase